MENNVIDDTPGQLYLFDHDQDKDKTDQDESDPGSWLDEFVSSDVVQHKEPGCFLHPQKSAEDCQKCPMLNVPQKGCFSRPHTCP